MFFMEFKTVIFEHIQSKIYIRNIRNEIIFTIFHKIINNNCIVLKQFDRFEPYILLVINVYLIKVT